MTPALAEGVRKRLIAALPKRIGQRRIADEMNMSVRTLQRKLHDEGVVYRRLVEQVHLQCAHYHLTNSSRALEEVAYLAGYSDAPSLIRAYKRHYGRAPRRTPAALA